MENCVSDHPSIRQRFWLLANEWTNQKAPSRAGHEKRTAALCNAVPTRGEIEFMNVFSFVQHALRDMFEEEEEGGKNNLER